MELDDLKAAWQKETQAGLATGKEQIELVLNGKATDMISSLKKKYEKIISAMLLGMLALVIAFPMLSDGFSYPGSINGFVKAMFFYLMAIIFYWAKLRSVSNLQLSDHIKERLQQLLTMLNRNLKIEQLFVVLFFISFILAGRFFYGHGLDGIFKPEVITGFVIAALVTAGLTIWIKKRYKKDIEELQGYLGEY